MGKIKKNKRILITVLMVSMIGGIMYSLLEIAGSKYDEKLGYYYDEMLGDYSEIAASGYNKMLVDYSRIAIGKIPKYAVLDKEKTEKTQAKYDKEKTFVDFDGPVERWVCFKGEGYYIEIKVEASSGWSNAKEARVTFIDFKENEVLSGPIKFHEKAWKIAEKINGNKEAQDDQYEE